MSILWRVLIAVFCCLIAWNLIPLVAAFLDLGLSATVLGIIKWCIIGIAGFYILRGVKW